MIEPLYTVMVTGAAGMVGREVLRTVPPSVNLRSFTREQLDITNETAVALLVERDRPDVIINAAVCLPADRAERDPYTARAVNTEGARHLAEAAKRIGARIIQVSTSYVFDGSACIPYSTDAPTNPLNAYALTKRDGELAVLKAMPTRSVVLRASWLYSATGRDVLGNMLENMRAGRPIYAASDRVGTPTFAGRLAEVIWQIAGMPELEGIHHWSDLGVASWYDFAVAVAEESAALGLISANVTVTPTRSEESASAVLRPRFSVLDVSCSTRLGFQATHWRTRLRSVLRSISHTGITDGTTCGAPRGVHVNSP